MQLLDRFEHNQVFSREEGWVLFRLTAIAEAIGWSLLIIGIAVEKYILPGNQIAVLLAGRVHGMLFLLYALSAIGLYPTLRWSRTKAFVALLASVPPYGSLLFEQWAWHGYQAVEFRTYCYCAIWSQSSR